MGRSKLLLILLYLLAFHSFLGFSQSADPDYTYRSATKRGSGKIYMGREIAKVMSFDGVDWLERNSRTQEENTNLAITKLPLTKSSVVADIGAGSGFYTFHIAPRVPKGKVYAVEIQDDAISYLQNKSKELQLKNVSVIKGTEKSPALPEGSLDLAIMVDVYHELLYPKEFLQSIKQALKSDGKLLLLEYKEEDPDIAIKKEHKMSVAQVRKELKANGFHLVQNGQFLPLQHFLVFQKD
jgi:precorrin-6B methylase 2